MTEKGNWSQPLRTRTALLCPPLQIHPVCTVPLLTVPCSSLGHQACQAFPYTWAFAHSSLSFWNVLSSTSRLFIFPQLVYVSPPQRRSHRSPVHSLFSSFPYLFPSFVTISLYCSLLSMFVSLTTVWVSWWQLNICLQIMVLQDLELGLVHDRQTLNNLLLSFF